MIRELTYKDRDAAIQLLREFFAEELEGRGCIYNEEQCYRDYDVYINLEQTIALCIETDGFIDGVLVGVILQRPFFGDITCQELAWYVRPSARRSGIKLLKQFEMICESRKCASISMVALTNSRVERIYELLGYEKHESCYTKNLN